MTLETKQLTLIAAFIRNQVWPYGPPSRWVYADNTAFSRALFAARTAGRLIGRWTELREVRRKRKHLVLSIHESEGRPAIAEVVIL